MAEGKYGRQLHFWDLEKREKVQTIDLGDEGLIPLEIRWQHDPDSAQGFVGATLSSNIIRFQRSNGSWTTDKVIDVGNEELEGWPLPGGVPGLITDLVLSLDDKDLFFSNWLHGDLRHYDVSDPANPQLRSQVWLGGLLGRDGGHPKASEALNGGPQMLQNSLDGERVYVSNSLYSTWDNQFYPGLEGLADQARPPARRDLRARSRLLRGLPRAGRGRAPARDPSARRRLHHRDLPVAP